MANHRTTPRLRVVFDTNLYIAAALRPAQHADTWLDIAASPRAGLQLFASEVILREVARTLTYKFGLPPIDVTRFVERLRTIATVVMPREQLQVVPDDPDDNAILECALAAQAHLVVSADHHLLKLGQYEGIGITHPRELKHIFAADYDQAA